MSTKYLDQEAEIWKLNPYDATKVEDRHGNPVAFCSPNPDPRIDQSRPLLLANAITKLPPLMVGVFHAIELLEELEGNHTYDDDENMDNRIRTSIDYLVRVMNQAKGFNDV